MKRIAILLTLLAALGGCKIEEAEYFDPTSNAMRIFERVDSHLSAAADEAARVMLFNLYYSAPEQEREAIHDRYFYSSRIVGSGDTWRIIDSGGELIVHTDGQPLSTPGAAWRYLRTPSALTEKTIACREEESRELRYDLVLPDGGGELSFTAADRSQPQPGGTTDFWCELLIEGRGTILAEREYDAPERADYEIARPLKYRSSNTRGFDSGRLDIETREEGAPLEIEVEYLPDHRIYVLCGPYGGNYYSHNYYWY